MNTPQLQTLQVGAIRMRIATQGSGPLVLLCHGWPESWRSWRAQLAALAEAGYRAVAPDMRGFGGTDAPEDPLLYSQLHLVGDMVALVRALGETQAVIIGHDWGAPVAWHAALLRPDVFRAVVGMSVPYSSPSPLDLLTMLEQQGITNFYMQYFQTPGVAEAELQADVPATLRRLTYSQSGDGPDRTVFGMLAPGAGLLGGTVEPPPQPQWPAWMSPHDLAELAADFERTGFRGGLNWYRNLRRNAGLMAPWHGCQVQQPALFITGSRDGVLRFPGGQQRMEKLPKLLPGLRGVHVLEGAGHWVQRERAEAVNALLLEFLKGL